MDNSKVEHKGRGFSWKNKYSWFLIGFVLVLGLLFYGENQAYSMYTRYSAASAEIQFAYEHPQIVRVMREQYASKSAQLEKEFTTPKDQQPTAEQQLLQEVAQQLKTSK